MKLFLHWLLWDLRRFRVVLLVWTLLVLGYAAFLGWLHLNILTVDPEWMEWSEPVAKGLGLTELGLLLYLFSTDPAVGTDPFWKTRPPAGWAVAGVKLAMALGFFVVLPMAAWQVMNAFCVVPYGNSRQWGGLSWTQFLWWVQTLVVSAFALGAAAARNPGEQLVKLAAALGVAAVPLLSLVWSPLDIGQIVAVFGIVLRGAMSPAMAWLGLFTGCGLFLAARFRRTPGRWVMAAVLCVPAVLLMVAPRLPGMPKPGVLDEEPDVLGPGVEPEVVAKVRIGKVLSLEGGPGVKFGWFPEGDGGTIMSVYRLKLEVSGLPADCRTYTRWQDVRLIAPDGRVVEADRGLMRRRSIRGAYSARPEVLSVGDAVFNNKELAPLANMACRLQGTLRIVLEGQQSATMPLRPGQVLETPRGLYHLAGDHFAGSLWQGMLTGVPRRQQRLELVSLEKPGTDESYGMKAGVERGATGYFMQSTQCLTSLSPADTVPGPLREQLRRNLIRGLTAKDWQLRFRWHEPQGSMEIPVTLEALVLPR